MHAFAGLASIALWASGAVAASAPAAHAQGAGAPLPKPGARLPQPYSPERVAAAFRAFDRDESSWLSFRELRVGFGVDRREFLVVDANGDGMVTLVEFEKHVRRQLENGAVLRWPSAAGATRPAGPASGPAASGPAGDQPFTFGNEKPPAEGGSKSAPPASKPRS